MSQRTLISVSIVVIVVATWYYIHNYTALFNKDINYYAYYDDAKGLQPSSPVFLRGVKVGAVSDVELHSNQRIVVTFSIDKEVKIPEGSEAIIGVGDLTGNKSVRLETSNSSSILPPNGKLRGGFDTAMIENFNAKITPYIHNGKVLLRTSDSALRSMNRIIRSGFGSKAQRDLEGLRRVLGNFARVTGSANMKLQSIHPTITNIDSSLNNPTERNSSINQSLLSTEKKWKEYAQKEMDKDLDETRQSINEVRTSLGKLRNHKLFSDKKDYQNAVLETDTFRRDVQEYYQNPPSPIRIFSGKTP